MRVGRKMRKWEAKLRQWETASGSALAVTTEKRIRETRDSQFKQ
jgi:hypothetical protein